MPFYVHLSRDWGLFSFVMKRSWELNTYLKVELTESFVSYTSLIANKRIICICEGVARSNGETFVTLSEIEMRKNFVGTSKLIK